MRDWPWYFRYPLWMSVTVVYNALVCYCAVKVNGTDFVKTWLAIALCGLLPNWALAAYMSRNLIFDGILYDMTLVMSGVPIMILLGQGTSFTALNWVGVVVAVLGILLMRVH